MDDLTTIVAGYGPYAFIVYIIIRDVLPKIFPSVEKVLSKRISTEDRLFSLLESNGTVLTKLSLSLIQLSDTLKEIDHRLSAIEENMSDNTSALRIASRLIAKD